MSQRDPDTSVADEPFQFGLMSILVLTTVAAVIFAVMRHTHFSSPGNWLFGGYLVLMASYLILRLPFLLRHLFGRSARWRALEQRRDDLAAWARNKASRNEANAEEDPADSSVRRDS